jgi:hypothetical protein
LSCTRNVVSKVYPPFFLICHGNHCQFQLCRQNHCQLELYITCLLLYLPKKIVVCLFSFICHGNHRPILPYLSSIFVAVILIKLYRNFLLYFPRKSFSNHTISFSVFAAGIRVNLYHAFLLYLPRETLSNPTVSFFCNCRGNPCQIVMHLSSTFCAEILV